MAIAAKNHHKNYANEFPRTRPQQSVILGSGKQIVISEFSEMPVCFMFKYMFYCHLPSLVQRCCYGPMIFLFGFHRTGWVTCFYLSCKRKKGLHISCKTFQLEPTMTLNCVMYFLPQFNTLRCLCGCMRSSTKIKGRIVFCTSSMEANTTAKHR